MTRAHVARTALHNIALDSGILSEFKMWLEPALDKSLPSLTIQRALFDLILRFPEISTDQLRESDLGKIVLFYTKCPRVDPAIKRQALGLVSAWLRPMLKKKAVWREKHVPRVGRGGVADDEDDGTAPRLSRREREQQDRIRQQALQAAIERGEGGTGAGVTNRLKDERMARIPNASVPMFKIAPKNRTDRTAETSEGTHFGSSTTRFRDYNKQSACGEVKGRADRARSQGDGQENGRQEEVLIARCRSVRLCIVHSSLDRKGRYMMRLDRARPGESTARRAALTCWRSAWAS